MQSVLEIIHVLLSMCIPFLLDRIVSVYLLNLKFLCLVLVWKTCLTMTVSIKVSHCYYVRNYMAFYAF